MITTTTLKNAAFAIEHDLWTDSDGANYLVKDGAILRRWEPATSSADSFELAVALKVCVVHGNDGRVFAYHDDDNETFIESRRENAAHGTRLAILMCAAAIGAPL